MDDLRDDGQEFDYRSYLARKHRKWNNGLPIFLPETCLTDPSGPWKEASVIGRS